MLRVFLYLISNLFDFAEIGPIIESVLLTDNLSNRNYPWETSLLNLVTGFGDLPF